MKLIPWSKIAKLVAPEKVNEFQDYELVYSQQSNSNALQKANYLFFKNTFPFLKEEFYKEKCFLMIHKEHFQKDSVQKELNKLQEIEILDEVLYQQELKKEVETVKKLGKCSLCGKELNDENSLLSSMGPVCEHKARLVETGKVSLESFGSFKALAALNPQKGETVLMKIKKDTTQDLKFVEVVDIKSDHYELIDRKLLSRQISSGVKPVEALANAFFKVKIADILGVSSLSEKEQESTGLMDEALSIFGDDNE